MIMNVLNINVYVINVYNSYNVPYVTEPKQTSQANAVAFHDLARLHSWRD